MASRQQNQVSGARPCQGQDICLSGVETADVGVYTPQGGRRRVADTDAAGYTSASAADDSSPLRGGAGPGWDPYEDYCMNVGDRVLDTSFLDYRVPSYTDLPMTPCEVLKVLEENRRGKTRP